MSKLYDIRLKKYRDLTKLEFVYIYRAVIVQYILVTASCVLRSQFDQLNKHFLLCIFNTILSF